MKKIEGSPKSLKQLLLNTKYTIHYYQREYKWERKNIEELIDDLTSEFLLYYKDGDSRQDVLDYGVYFMGSVVLAGRENAIVDGQQRLTSLTLMLMYLNNRLKKLGKSYNTINQMIYSESVGRESFNIEVNDKGGDAEREDCMRAIFEDRPFEPSQKDESVVNIYNRYNEIVEGFPEEINDEIVLHFADWLVEKVFFIEIVATTEQDAHKIFVSMNDRGLSLTSTEMLKGFLLSEVSSDEKRKLLNEKWKTKIVSLKENDNKGDEVFIKAWLRSQYAETIRDTKAGAVNKDFDIIGGPFHKWVRDEKDRLGLKTSSDYEAFMARFEKYADIYLKIKNAESTFDENLKYVYYNAQLNFTLQSQLLLAPICFEDTDEIINEKLNLVARYIDLWMVVRTTRFSSVDYSTIKNYVFNLTKEIRRCDVPTLKEKLLKQYEALEYNPSEALKDLRLNGFTKKYIKHILARLTGFVEENMGVVSNYVTYVRTDVKNPFEVEHIITDHFEWYTDEYTDLEDFKLWRNKIGNLLLLHKSINASLNDSKYNDKLPKYGSNEGNILSESLCDIAYTNNPQFLRFKNDNNLSFKAYSVFGKNEISERTDLYFELFKLVYNPDMFVISGE